MTGAPSGGNRPAGRLIQLADGALYATTIVGGLADSGSTFRISPPTAKVAITGLTSERPGVTTVTVSAPPGWTCHLDQTGDLGAPKWTEVAKGKAAASGVAVLSDSFGVGQKVRFYRVWAAPS
jgi:hypothetical protein